MNNVVPLTQKGLERLRQEIQLLEYELGAIKEAQTEALDSGGNGWHDNASYEDLLERERVAAGRLEELQDILHHSTVSASDSSVTQVQLGALVSMKMTDGSMRKYTLTDPFSVDIAKGLISYESPVGKALIQKSVGDVVLFGKGEKTTSGTIVAIEYN